MWQVVNRYFLLSQAVLKALNVFYCLDSDHAVAKLSVTKRSVVKRSVVKRSVLKRSGGGKNNVGIHG
jgi:hypothetical protein